MCFLCLGDRLTAAMDEWDRARLNEPGSIIKRFVDPLTRQAGRPARSLLTSDQEHARSIGPVLTPSTPVYILYHHTAQPTAEEINCVLEQGRVFVNYEEPHDQGKMPNLMIRPVDGKTRIPFLIRASITPTGAANIQSSLSLFVRFPIIFSPRLDVRRVHVGLKQVDFSVAAGVDEGVFSVTVPLDSLAAPDSDVRFPVEVLMEGSVTLGDYSVLPADQFANWNSPMDPRVIRSARLAPGRDFVGAEEEEQLRKLTAELVQLAPDPYQQVVLAQRFTSSRITYFNNNMNRTAMQVLAEGMGDCDDFSRVMVALLRGVGIPSRIAVGYLYDFNNMGAHAWVEAALPTKSGKLHWFICDPTLAGASTDKDYFVQFKNRIYLYPIRLEVRVQNLAAQYRVETLLNWSGKEKLEKLPAASLPALLNSFTDSLHSSFAQTIGQLRAQNLILRRQFLFTPASNYILSERPVTAEQSQLTISIDSNERMLADLSVLDDDFALDSPEDQRFLMSLRQSYENLKESPFEGYEARHCLELTYYRDPYTDRLQRVRLRISRYLVEQHMRRIVESFQKTGLLTAEDAARISALHQVCAGKNLYYLQELARLSSARTPVATQPSVEEDETCEDSIEQMDKR